jgi:uncharacterized protein
MSLQNAIEARIRPVAQQSSDDYLQPDETAVLKSLKLAVEHAAHLLPAQGPITSFVHHNTLHAFEEYSFVDAVRKAGRIFGCEPFMSEERYRDALAKGRISSADLRSVLDEDLAGRVDECVVPTCTHGQLRLAMLEHPLRTGPAAELLWCVAETDALRHMSENVSAAVRMRLIAQTRRWVMRDLRNGEDGAGSWTDGLLGADGGASLESWQEAQWEGLTLRMLWRICCNGVASAPVNNAMANDPVRHRDLLLAVSGVDADLLVHDVLIPFCAAYLDQGLSHWSLPGREHGFFQAFIQLYRRPLGAAAAWRRGLPAQIADIEKHGLTPLRSIHNSLDQLGVPPSEWEAYLAATVLALRGWGGMIRQVEIRHDRVVRPIPQDSFMGFLAIRLLLDRLALASVAQEMLGYGRPLHALRHELRLRMPPRRERGPEQRAFNVFQLAQALGWTPEFLSRLRDEDWRRLVDEIMAFSPHEQRRILHLAYERRFYTRTLDAVMLHNRKPNPDPASPQFQAMFCIDEREESMRRHLEEVAPNVVTFSIAGFYFIDMYYKGLADAHFAPLCPPIIQPKHWVAEIVAEDLAESHRRRAQTRHALGMASHQLHIGSRTFVVGALMSAALGALASIPLVARTLFPRLTARLRKMCGAILRPPHQTRLDLETGEAPTDTQPGYTLDGMVDIAERVLRDTGLTSGFARLIFTFGHGSSSVNNPHESAYNCGACGGGQGSANGRAIAQILNDARVRERLVARGIAIPGDTVFIGGMHNTGNDQITFFDLDHLPSSHHQEFDAARRLLEQASDRNSHERCRRFESASLGLAPRAARAHTEGRAEDLAQVRPELGHATNAICIVGRRRRTRGLFLDRRAFLNCYDPTQDDKDGTILARILQAAVPVCAGISLEYYFSCVDNRGYGCGTKLPHNVASLLGVMDGALSDLRTGLPWQMVEIHEPVRILFIIETTPDKMLGIMDRDVVIGRLVRNGWVKLAVLDPELPELRVYRNGAFEKHAVEAEALPSAASSLEWYRGWRDHLEFAEIVPHPG